MKVAGRVSLVASLLMLSIQSPLATTDSQESLIEGFCAAVAAGQDVMASNLLCQITVQGVECGRDDPHRQYYRDARALWHRRYSEVFLPPANADSLTRSGWQEAMPWGGGTYGGVAYLSSQESGIPLVRYVPWDGSIDDLNRKSEAIDTPSYMTLHYFGRLDLVIDLDLDREPDVTFDGSMPTVADGLMLISDDAGDGQRFQWMIGPEGSDARSQPRVWIYRDGCYYNLFLDTDGDGRGNCGAGGRIP